MKYYPISFEDINVCPNCYRSSLEIIDNFGGNININNLLKDEQLYTKKTLTKFKCRFCGKTFPIEWVSDGEGFKPVPLINYDTSEFIKNYANK